MEVKRKGSLLSFRPDIKVLDATLRDGGLCNNFEFSDEFAKALYKMNVAAGVDYMEMGYKASKAMFDVSKFGKYKFCDEADVQKIASLADFAARKHYSADYVGKRIRRQTGTSFSRRLNEARLREAARLLAETELSVESIAAAVGYADPAGLYKRFRAAFGMTPGEYRLSFE